MTWLIDWLDWLRRSARGRQVLGARYCLWLFFTCSGGSSCDTKRFRGWKWFELTTVFCFGLASLQLLNRIAPGLLNIKSTSR